MKVVDRQRLFSVFCLVSTLFSYSLFLVCYFPFKQGLGGYASRTDAPPEPYSGREGVPGPHYSRLVLMVVDALRTDFALGNLTYMPFTQQLLGNGRGVAFSAKTHLPTVTLPRLKAITSGTIPGFVDVLLNFGTSALSDDNLITQLKLAGKILTFFGDDTWLNLFPDHFARSDGTVSFFVTDFTEVDANVTRHLKEELSAEDWDMMTLHYLGLDHIGHMYGPTSNLVAPKLLEMDAVVHQIFTAMNSWSTERPSVLVICGDHGMSDQGGHGGASPGETSVPVIIISPHTQFQPQQTETQELQQVDLCPTMSAFLGLPIPRNNLGRVVVAALPLNAPLEDKVRLLHLNAAQIANILEKNVEDIEEDQAYHLYQDSIAAHSSWLSTKNSSSAASWEAVGTRVLMGYQDAVQRMSQRISQTSTNYDMYGIVIAIVSLSMNLFIQILVPLCNKPPSLSCLLATGVAMLLLVMLAILSHVTICTSQHSSKILCGTSSVSLIVQMLTLVTLVFSGVLLGKLVPAAVVSLTRFQSQVENPLAVQEVGLVGCIGLHSLSLLSSSFVEEEHQTWYFFTSTLHALLLLYPIASLTVWYGLPRVSESTRTAQQYLGDSISGSNSCQNSGSSSSSSFTRIRNRVRSEEVHLMHCQEKKRDTAQPQELSVEQCVKMVVSLVGILLLFRILRRWNQTGNKWLDIPDVGDWLCRPENKGSLSVLALASLFCLLLTRLRCLHGLMSRAMFVGALTSVYCSKAASGSLLLPSIMKEFVSYQGVIEARLAYLFILGLLVCSLKWTTSLNISTNHCIPSSCSASLSTDSLDFPNEHCHRSHLCDQIQDSVRSRSSETDQPNCSEMGGQIIYKHKAVWEAIQVMWLSVMCLLLRPHNIAEVVMVSLVEKLACDYVLPFVQLRPVFLLLYCLLMGQASFFFQGNSNSISTVDVSAGMAGLYDYQPVIMAVQMAVSTYAGVFFWLITSCKYITMVAPLHNTQQWLSNTYTEMCGAALLTRALPLALYTLLVTHMRYHLFVWTVFSPKLLYEGMLTVVMSGFCGACLWMASALKKSSKVKL